jgi:hypothetical protein
MKPLETLRALGTGGEAPVEAKQRVHSALMASLGTVAVTTGAAAGAQSGTLAPTSAPLIGGLSSAKVLATAAGLWLVGGVTGALLYGALHPQEVRVVYVDRPVLSTSAVTPPVGIVPGASAANAPGAAAVDPSSMPALAASVGPVSQLSRERALLDLARASAARGEPALSLQQTERHRAQFPRGKLSEEREAMAIRALHSLGRDDEARSRAQAFRVVYPNSFLTPAIDSALFGP